MFDPERLLGQMLSGSLGNIFGGRGRSLLGGDLGGKTALGMGALGVAIAAYEHYTESQKQPASGGPPPPPPPSAGPPPPPPPTRAATPTTQAKDDALLLVRTMIAAAAADGRIDDDERQAILSRAAGIDADERRLLETELASPRTPAQIAAATRPGFAPQVYAAALLAVRVDTLEESDWLEQLGFALGLDGGTRAQIAQQLAGGAR
ncbi:tellurite resistance TerB family protein [Tahibacter soli]|uniref:Tellurite resistance TerB family protein n=1 Tax=Tahibacter soli TaxID=2983605 RepID=A0A9X4BIX2_9GAMM|nr:tellurite resistance TerB family protein [Tahibacter soli]MDC8015720.1 tellurite resistance TerB family protein [Tahibacter soli]